MSKVQRKFLLCEEFATKYELPVDYVWTEIVNPEVCSLKEVQNVLNQMGLFSSLNPVTK